MHVTRIEIPGVLVFEPVVLSDHRGVFTETYHEDRYRNAGIREDFVQDNYSRSIRNTLRGLHFQEPHAQGKLVMALEGTVFDVVVDIRKGSPSFGKWYGVELSGENLRQMYIPPGCAHGFCVTSASASFLYKCTAYYSREHDRGVRWDDSALEIPWPISEPILSQKDQNLPTISAIEPDLPVYRPGG